MADTGDWDDAADNYDPDLDSFADYRPVQADAGDEFAALDPLVSGEDANPVQTALFTVTNPEGTVSATSLIGGRIHEVVLSGNASAMTEAELADEILVIARLATQKAKAAQHAVILELMQSMGNDRAMLGGFLEHQIGLPTPETVTTETATLFASRYQDRD